MRRLLPPAAAALVAAALLAPSASARVHHLTLRYLAVQTSQQTHDIAPKNRLNPGDYFSFREKLLVPRGVAGSDHVRCDILPRTRFFCRGRLFFREGTISVRGILTPSRGASYLALTGGTRLFRGQRGTVRVADAPHGHTYLRLTLR